MSDLCYDLIEVLESKGRNTAQSMPNKKKRDHIDKEDNKDNDRLASFTTRGLVAEKEDELLLLRGQLDELHRKLSAKDDLLKSAEITQARLQADLEELQHECAKKDLLFKSIQLQLSDAKVPAIQQNNVTTDCLTASFSFCFINMELLLSSD